MSGQAGDTDTNWAGVEVRPMLHLKFHDPELMGTPDEIPGLLMARINGRRLGLRWAFGLVIANACALFLILGISSVVPEESTVGHAFLPLMIPFFLHPVFVLVWANARLSAATDMARWLSREAMADDVLALPISGRSWAVAQWRLFARSSAGGLAVLMAPFAPVMFQSMFPDPRPMFWTVLGIVVAFNWAIYWVAVAGGRGPVVALSALLGFYPALLGIAWAGYASPSSRPFALAAESVVSSLWTLGAFTAWALAIGVAGFRRSWNAYRGILRDRVEALPAARISPARP